MKIMLTGGMGFIGSSLINRKSEHQFVACIKNSKENSKKISNVIFESCKIENLDFFNIVKKHSPDLIIHLASLTGLKNCEENPSKAFITNVFGTYNVIKACVANKTRLIFLSSREVYGNRTDEVKENSFLKPINVYGITKKIGEEMIISEHKKSCLDYTILRLSNVYGPGSVQGVNKMIQSAIINKKIFLNGGEQVVNLIFIDKVIDIIFDIINNKRTYNQIFNVGSFDNISIKEFAKKISVICTNNVKIIQNEPIKIETQNFKLNLKKLSKITDLSSKVDLDEGIRKTIRWIQKENET